MSATDMSGCYSCAMTADADAPLREQVARTAYWRVAHAFASELNGWLILAPLRHVESFAELSPAEMSDFGTLLGACSRALPAVVACTKTYVMQFSEAPGYHHLHVHVVPRSPDLPVDRRGPAVFAYLGDEPGPGGAPAEVDAMVADLAPRIAAELVARS